MNMAATGFYPDSYRDSRISVQHHRPPIGGLISLFVSYPK